MNVRIENGSSGLQNSDIRWYLSDEELWITKYESYCDIEKSIANSEGSFNWLYDINDTVLFEKDSKKFETAIINLSNIITTVKFEDMLIDEYTKKDGNIFFVSKMGDFFQFPHKIIYEEDRDFLFSFQGKVSNVVLVSITDDFGFFVENGILCGWILKNASRYVHTSLSEEHNGKETKGILYKYLTNLKVYEDNEDDEVLKEMYQEIKEYTDYMSLEVKKCLKNILDLL